MPSAGARSAAHSRSWSAGLPVACVSILGTGSPAGGGTPSGMGVPNCHEQLDAISNSVAPITAATFHQRPRSEPAVTALAPCAPDGRSGADSCVDTHPSSDKALPQPTLVDTPIFPCATSCSALVRGVATPSCRFGDKRTGQISCVNMWDSNELRVTHSILLGVPTLAENNVMFTRRHEEVR